MKKYLDRLCVFCLFLLAVAPLQCLANGGEDYRYVGEQYPPLIIKYQGKEIAVFFLKNNLKRGMESRHAAAGEIFYFQTNPLVAELHYAWKVEGDQISDVFFYDWKGSRGGGRSMFVLTKTILSDRYFRGDSYSVIELPLISKGPRLSLNFFPGDHPDPLLINCRDGVDLKTGLVVGCKYRDAASVVRYLSSIDK